MKQINLFLSICLILVFLVGCSSNSPESVAEDFTQALYVGDAEKAKQYCTPETREGLDFMAKFFGSEDFKEDRPTRVSVKAAKCELSEDETEATVYLSVTYTSPKDGKKEGQTKVNLVKYDGTWMVRFKAK